MSDTELRVPFTQGFPNRKSALIDMKALSHFANLEKDMIGCYCR